MRIAYLSTFYPFRGGIAQFNASLCRALLEQGHALKAYTFSRQYPEFLFPGKTQKVGAADAADPFPAEVLLDSVGPWTWGRTARRIAEDQPELLLMKYWMSFFSPSLGAVAARLRAKGTRVVTVLDNVLPHERRFFDVPLTRRFLERNDGFVVMSRSVEADLDRFRPQAPRLYHGHPVYDHFGEALDRQQARAELGWAEDETVLLFFGFVRAYKGLDVLLEAFDRLEGKYRLVVAGEPYMDVASLEARVQASPRRANIDLRFRYIPDDETRLLFSAADACILPYKSATQSGIALIAYQFRLPLVVTATGGLGEYVKDGENGILVERAEPALLAEGIERFRKQGGHARFSPALAGIRERLSWPHFAEELLAFAESLPVPGSR
jgi:glycosyltransferase involved in cell wall biosynthesis